MMNDFEKWMLLPKFRVQALDNPELGKYIAVFYGDLKDERDIVHSCFEYPDTIEKLVSHLECALNSLLKVYHLQPKEIEYAPS
jgi:hypothetical protein